MSHAHVILHSYITVQSTYGHEFYMWWKQKKKEWKALMTIIHSNSSNFDLTFIFFFCPYRKKKSHPVKHKKIQQSGEKNFFSSFHVFFIYIFYFLKRNRAEEHRIEIFRSTNLPMVWLQSLVAFFFRGYGITNKNRLFN